jgi:proteasome lid subunit RPN8/RPN11
MPIKISNEEKRKIERVLPPENIAFVYMPDETDAQELRSFLAARFGIRGNAARPPAEAAPEKEVERTTSSHTLDFYVGDAVVRQMFNHAAQMAHRQLEAMGFLIGEVCRWQDAVFSVVHDVVTSELEATSVSVRFRRDAFDDLFEQLDDIDYDYVLLGWYHSHPGYTSFMSDVDVDTQSRMFTQPFHAAIVVDPLTVDMKAFRLARDACVEIPYAVYEAPKPGSWLQKLRSSFTRERSSETGDL